MIFTDKLATYFYVLYLHSTMSMVTVIIVTYTIAEKNSSNEFRNCDSYNYNLEFSGKSTANHDQGR